MVKLSTSIFGGAGIAAILLGAFLVVREIRGSGQDLSQSITEGVLKGVGSQTQQAFSSFGTQISTAFSNIKLPTLPKVIPQSPLQQTALQQKELFGQVLTPQQQQEITKIDLTVQAGQKVIPETVAPSDLGKFNPPGVFGFGFLGADKRGISEQLAKRLNIFGLRTDEISRLQRVRLQTIGSTQTLQDLFATRQTSSVNRFLTSFNVTDFSGLTFGVPQRSVGTTPQIMMPQTPSTTSFVGSSLSDIINRLGVSASRARSIQQFGITPNIQGDVRNFA